MRLRRIGNSLGTTFTKLALQDAGFTEDDELIVSAVPGEIRITKAAGDLLLEISPLEAEALASGRLRTRIGRSAVAKLKALLASRPNGNE
jgi:antitoxin component of MazEF toxin-antitoxin module